jgi:hypothetical protein
MKRLALISAILMVLGMVTTAQASAVYTLNSRFSTAPDYFDPDLTDSISATFIWDSTAGGLSSMSFTIRDSQGVSYSSGPIPSSCISSPYTVIASDGHLYFDADNFEYFATRVDWVDGEYKFFVVGTHTLYNGTMTPWMQVEAFSRNQSDVFIHQNIDSYPFDGSWSSPKVSLDMEPIPVTTLLAFADLVAPEPSSLALLGVGAISLLAYAWRKRKRAA